MQQPTKPGTYRSATRLNQNATVSSLHLPQRWHDRRVAPTRTVVVTSLRPAAAAGETSAARRPEAIDGRSPARRPSDSTHRIGRTDASRTHANNRPIYIQDVRFGKFDAGLGMRTPKPSPPPLLLLLLLLEPHPATAR
jgi:hypothetical protein